MSSIPFNCWQASRERFRLCFLERIKEELVKKGIPTILLGYRRKRCQLPIFIKRMAFKPLTDNVTFMRRFDRHYPRKPSVELRMLDFITYKSVSFFQNNCKNLKNTSDLLDKMVGYLT